jgi:hypothetical protein
VETRDAARRWVETWRENWPANKPEPIAALYAEGGTYGTAPFREPYVGPAGAMSYLVPVLEAQKEVRAWFGEPIVDGDRAAVQWWATALEPDGRLTYAGVSILRFNSDGLVVDEWDAWNVDESEREPTPGWGRTE